MKLKDCSNENVHHTLYTICVLVCLLVNVKLWLFAFFCDYSTQDLRKICRQQEGYQTEEVAQELTIKVGQTCSSSVWNKKLSPYGSMGDGHG